MTEEERVELESDTEEYAELLSQKNYEREKFNLLLRSFLEPGVNLDELLESFVLAFDMDNADGKQLDVIGSLIGASRLLPYVPSEGDREMDDDEFRMVLKLTVAQNTWDGTLGSLGPIYRDVFGDDVSIRYADNQNMTVDINVYGDLSSREAEILDNSGLMLKPVGVGKTVILSGGSATASVYGQVEITGIGYVETAIARGVNI